MSNTNNSAASSEQFPSKKQYFLLGVRQMALMIPAIAPFGLVTGITCKNMGLSFEYMLSMSAFIFAGSSQLVTLDLIAQNSLMVVTILSALMINLRFTMYSAALAPHFSKLNRPTQAFYCFLLTDQNFGYHIIETEKPMHSTQHYDNLHLHYLGAGITLWLTWIFTSIAGYFLGALIPSNLRLEFCIPLMFLALAVMSIKTNVALLVALISATVAVKAKPLPYNLGFLLAAFSGIAVGVIIDSIKNRSSNNLPTDPVIEGQSLNEQQSADIDQGQATADSSSKGAS